MPKSSPREASLRTAIDGALRAALIEHIVANPDLTLAELVGLSGDLGAQAKSVTIRELMGGKLAPRTSKRGRARTPAKATGKGAVDTRTPTARAAYDGAILKFLRSKRRELSAQDVRAECGGTELQARTALHRLMKSRKIKASGKARATKYRAK